MQNQRKHERGVATLKRKSTVKSRKSTDDENEKDKEEEEEHKPTCLENMTPFVLMIGLGAHAVFEGIALGLGKSMENVLAMVLAIGLHKGAASMSLGISMQKTFPD